MERILNLHLTLHRISYPGNRRILITTHVDNVIIALILHRTAGVKSLQRLIACLEVISRAGLVAKTPDDNARVVNTCVSLFHHSGYMGGFPFLRVGE